MSDSKERVVILGASNKPDRYSYKALRMLQEHGHEVLPVHPIIPEIEGVEVAPNLNSVEGPVDTVTMYVNSSVSEPMADDFLKLAPRRVIFNPGAEAPALQTLLEAAGIDCEEACTLVLLQTGAF